MGNYAGISCGFRRFRKLEGLILYPSSVTCIFEHILMLQFDLELGIIDYFPISKSRIRIGLQRPFYRNSECECCAFTSFGFNLDVT